MGNYGILDDAIITENLDTNIVWEHSQKIAQRALILAIFFAVFAGAFVIVTIEVLGKGQIEVLIPILCTQFGTIIMSFRLFFYQWHIRKKQDWALIFEAKRKVWMALAVVLTLTLSAVSILIFAASGLF